MKISTARRISTRHDLGANRIVPPLTQHTSKNSMCVSETQLPNTSTSQSRNSTPFGLPPYWVSDDLISVLRTKLYSYQHTSPEVHGLETHSLSVVLTGIFS